MAPDVSGGERNPPSTGKSKHVLKKGPWTTSEDMLLVEYVKKHGEGNWNAVQRNSGLMRCGKSCRLRWANHLRPNLKKGAFTPDEEKLIVELHARLGNKWARMAAQLPGRTDNEIKNYWNTRLKRRQRAGLPIYPYQALKQEHHHHLQNSSSPSPPLLSSRLASSRPSNPNHSIFYNAFTPPPLIISPSHNQSKLYGANGGPSNLFFNMGIPNPMPMTSSLRYNALDYVGTDMGVLGLPSIQSPAVTPAASSSDFVVGTTSGEDYEVDRGLGGRSKSGLLEDLLGESRALACPEKTEEPFVAADERVHEKGEAFGFEHGDVSIDNKYEDLETKASEDGNNVIDDDLLHLLDNFPLSVPIPNWEEAHSNESSILSNGTNSVLESQRNISRYNTVVTSISAANQDWNFGSCLWNNMPSIY